MLKVDGFDLTDKKTDFRKLRSKVGMVFQYPEYQLFAETVAADVAFGLKNFSDGISEDEINRSVKEALETVGLDYEEVKDRSPFELSGGQKRRVAIAGVIVTNRKSSCWTSRRRGWIRSENRRLCNFYTKFTKSGVKRS